MHLVERYRPDVAVFAVGLTDGDGVDAARQVMASYPCALVVLTSRTEPAAVDPVAVRFPAIDFAVTGMPQRRADSNSAR